MLDYLILEAKQNKSESEVKLLVLNGRKMIGHALKASKAHLSQISRDCFALF